MSRVVSLIKAIHQVMGLQDDVAALARAVEKLAELQAGTDRRLARIEGMVELSLANRRLPDEQHGRD